MVYHSLYTQYLWVGKSDGRSINYGEMIWYIYLYIYIASIAEVYVIYVSNNYVFMDVISISIYIASIAEVYRSFLSPMLLCVFMDVFMTSIALRFIVRSFMGMIHGIFSWRIIPADPWSDQWVTRAKASPGTGSGMILQVPGLVNVQKTMERSIIFNGKIHYFDWAIFNSYVSHYQRVEFAEKRWIHWSVKSSGYIFQ